MKKQETTYWKDCVLLTGISVAELSLTRTTQHQQTSLQLRSGGTSDFCCSLRVLQCFNGTDMKHAFIHIFFWWFSENSVKVWVEFGWNLDFCSSKLLMVATHCSHWKDTVTWGIRNLSCTCKTAEQEHQKKSTVCTSINIMHIKETRCSISFSLSPPSPSASLWDT